MFANLEVFLKRKVEEASSPALVERAANALARDMLIAVGMTGEDMTGVMRKNLSYIDKPQPTSSGWSIWVGRGGGEDEQAPSGTIAQFLHDYPQYRRSFADRGKAAWWSLNIEARRLLATKRATGMYGGKVGQSPYYYLQEEGDWSVGIVPRHFVQYAIQNFESHVADIMREVFSA